MHEIGITVLQRNRINKIHIKRENDREKRNLLEGLGYVITEADKS